MIQMLFRHVKYVVLPIIVGLILQGCSASVHPGVTTVKKPAMNEQNEEVWFEYWQDQFDAKSGRVIAPPANHPEVSKSAYSRAKQEWTMLELEAKNKTTVAWSLGILGVIIFAAYILPSILLSNAIDDAQN